MMELRLAGQRITRESVGFAVTLRTDVGYEVRIETSFSVHAPEGDADFSLGVGGPEVDKFPSLLWRTVTFAMAEKSGALVLNFADGATLRVGPHDSYEAWTLAGPHGEK